MTYNLPKGWTKIQFGEDLAAYYNVE